jgi:hypothetical protein
MLLTDVADNAVDTRSRQRCLQTWLLRLSTAVWSTSTSVNSSAINCGVYQQQRPSAASVNCYVYQQQCCQLPRLSAALSTTSANSVLSTVTFQQCGQLPRLWTAVLSTATSERHVISDGTPLHQR